MKASAFVGRVGGLSVALGIGVIAGGIGLGAASASPADSSAGTDAAGSARSRAGAATSSVEPRAAQPHAAQGRPRSAAGSTGEPAVAGADKNDSTPVQDRPAATTTTRVDSHEVSREVSIDLPAQTVARASAAEPETSPIADAPAPAPQPVAVTTAAPVAQLAAAGPTSSLSDASPADPSVPAAAAAASVVLAASRRQPTASAVTGSAAATGADPIATLFFNQTPTVGWAQGPQSGLGVVTGTLWVDDADSADFTATYTDGLAGEVFLGDDGTYTYTPYSAQSSSVFSDHFDVTMSDAGSGFHIHGIGGLLNLLTFGLLGSSGHETTTTVVVDVAPYGRTNTAPTATAVVGVNDPITGRVTGTVTGSDADGDVLTYGAPASTAKGTVSIDAGTGAFSYTPTTAARKNAADLTDTFTVTVTDGYGGATTVPIAVAISPALPEPTVSVKGWSASGAEGNSGTTTIPVVVQLSQAAAAPVTVYYSVVEQPLLSTAATPYVDFRPESGSVTIAAGQTEGTINVTVYGDTGYEADEYVRVELTGADGAVVNSSPSQYRQTVTVTNDDQPAGALVSFAGGSVSRSEGNSGTTLVPVTVQLSQAAAAPVTVYYSVVEQPLLSTAATPWTDFRPESGSVTIAAGQTQGTINVAVYGDTSYETDELVRVELTGADGGTLNSDPSKYRQTLTITNDDQPAGALVSFAGGSVSRAEGNSVSTTVPVTVQLSQAAAAPVTVYYSVVEQPLLSTAATPWTDFKPESGSVTIAAGQTQGTINVTVYGDTSYETDELVRVELTGADGGTLNSDPSKYRQTVTITNDDPASVAV